MTRTVYVPARLRSSENALASVACVTVICTPSTVTLRFILPVSINWVMVTVGVVIGSPVTLLVSPSGGAKKLSTTRTAITLIPRITRARGDKNGRLRVTCGASDTGGVCDITLPAPYNIRIITHIIANAVLSLYYKLFAWFAFADSSFVVYVVSVAAPFFGLCDDALLER